MLSHCCEIACAELPWSQQPDDHRLDHERSQRPAGCRRKSGRSSELWNRLEQFQFDSGTTHFGFSDRLARENGWTKAEAERVIFEYKRFLFLAMTAGHPVTPSETVDQVWHLHLTYTQSYWNSLCEDVLGRPHVCLAGQMIRDLFHAQGLRAPRPFGTGDVHRQARGAPTAL